MVGSWFCDISLGLIGGVYFSGNMLLVVNLVSWILLELFGKVWVVVV